MSSCFYNTILNTPPKTSRGWPPAAPKALNTRPWILYDTYTRSTWGHWRMETGRVHTELRCAGKPWEGHFSTLWRWEVWALLSLYRCDQTRPPLSPGAGLEIWCPCQAWWALPTQASVIVTHKKSSGYSRSKARVKWVTSLWRIRAAAFVRKQHSPELMLRTERTVTRGVKDAASDLRNTRTREAQTAAGDANARNTAFWLAR